MDIEQMKARIEEIDNILDNDVSLSNVKYDELENEARMLVEEIGKIESNLIFKNVKEITNCSSWIKGFLNLFENGTRNITNRQAQVFEKINQGKPFKFEGRRFDCSGANYRVGFSTLIITKL